MSRIDLGYICFAWIAFVPWVEPMISMVPVGRGIHGFVLTLFSIPIVLVTVGAGVIATYVVIAERRERSLVFMLLLMTLMFVLFLAVDFFQVVNRDTARPAYIGLSSVIGLFSIHRLRRVQRPTRSSSPR